MIDNFCNVGAEVGERVVGFTLGGLKKVGARVVGEKVDGNIVGPGVGKVDGRAVGCNVGS